MICPPALIYFILALISIMLSVQSNVSASTTVIHFIFALLWTILLNFLCLSGYTVVSWILLLLPFILFLLIMLLAIEIVVYDSVNKSQSSSVFSSQPSSVSSSKSSS